MTVWDCAPVPAWRKLKETNKKTTSNCNIITKKQQPKIYIPKITSKSRFLDHKKSLETEKNMIRELLPVVAEKKKILW